MNITVDGFSWGNVYKHIENMYNNDMVQIPCKYADTVTRHIMSVLDEVSDWLEPATGSAQESTADNSSGGDTTAQISKMPEKVLDEKFSDDNLLMCNRLETNVSAAGILTTATSPDLVQYLSCKNELDKKEEIVPTKAHNCSDPIHEESHAALSSHTWPCGLPSVPQLADEAFRSDSFEKDSIKGDMILSGYESPSQTYTMCESTSSSKDFFSPMKCFANEDERHTEHGESESFRREIEFGILNGFNSGKICNTLDALDLNAEVGELQDIDLHDILEDDEEYVQAIISFMESRKKSFKEKLARRFLSKLRLLKNLKKVKQSHNTCVSKQSCQGSKSSTHIHDTLDSDWELL